MKFGKLLTSLIIAILFTGNIMAAIVQPESAANVARNFMFERFVRYGSSISINEIQPQLFQVRESNGQPAFYVFNIENGGWVIVSADDVYSPVIGFSPEGAFPVGELDKNYSSFLQDYVDQIDFARSNNIVADKETIAKWNEYSTMSNPRVLLEGDRDVEPLLSNLWNQDFPYNAYCPEDPGGSGGHVYAGCVATAMSQIMHYYRYPEVGTGQYSYNSSYGTLTANFGETYYNWDAMQNSITAGMGPAVNAVAELQYHCGVSVRMDYGIEGSGAQSSDVPAAIKNYFGYSSTAQFIQKMGYTTIAWENILVDHIDAEKPLYYSGYSSEGGHAFVCDGYQVTSTGKLFHYNFGWSGYSNGYYSLTDVGGYNSNQGMVRNFIPNPSNYPYYCDNHIVDNHIGSIEDGSGPLETYLANSACTWLISPVDSVTSITLNFTEIAFGLGDSIKVYGGADENAPLLATYGQGSSIAALTSHGNRMFVKFLTDGSDEGEGFKAEFSSTFPTYCSSGITTLTSPTGDFSDGSGDHNYNNNNVCKWKITPGPWAVDLTLVFTSFDLEEGKDFLKVFAVPTNQLLADLTGSEIPNPIVSPTGQFMLMFSTNGFNNLQGFEASYYIANVNASNEDIAENLSIYPNPASSYTDVKFNLAQPSNIQISVHNLLGEEIYNIPSQMLSGFVSRTIQLSGLSKGIYLVKISGDNGSLVRKLVVN